MKEKIHPKYVECTVQCGCGNSWTTRSTEPELKIEICSACHPFFKGGGSKLVDTLGRVDRFTKKFGAQTSEQRKVAAKAVKATKAATKAPAKKKATATTA